MLMQNLGGQTKSIMVFSEVAYSCRYSYLRKVIWWRNSEEWDEKF